MARSTKDRRVSVSLPPDQRELLAKLSKKHSIAPKHIIGAALMLFAEMRFDWSDDAIDEAGHRSVLARRRAERAAAARAVAK